ncbi:MAG: amidohydrolase [Clostridia bacterium]
MIQRDEVLSILDRDRTELVNLSDEIWELAEVGLQEHRSARAQEEFLRARGFEIESGVAEMPTAFVATRGSGKPVIAFLGEFDALPGTSQRKKPSPEPLKEGAPGHACGHNLLGVGALGAAVALAEALENAGVAGEVRYYGCPAEETLVGKVFMVKAGLFEDVDAAITWHPASVNAVRMDSTSAMNSFKVTFFGVSSHAAGAPELGRSALDAAELMNVGANYLREHVIEQARIHYVITDGGGEPNVVPPEAEVWYYVRAPERDEVEEIYQRILRIAEGATLMTDTSHEVRFLSGCYNKLLNRPMAELVQKNLEFIGGPKFSEEDHLFAEEMLRHLPPGQRNKAVRSMEGRYDAELDDVILHEEVLPMSQPRGRTGGGSTDVADVSWVVPTIEFSAASSVLGAAGHSWQVTACSGNNIGHSGMMVAAKVMALTGLDLIGNPASLEEAWADFRERTKDNPYKSPIPEGVMPPLDQLPQH